MTKRIYLCEDSLDGIMTAVYGALKSGEGWKTAELRTGEVLSLELFAEYVNVDTDAGKAEAAAGMIRRRFGEDGWNGICHAALSGGEDKADAIYRMIVEGLGMRDGRRIMEHLGNAAVGRVFELSRTVANEAHRHLGFIRFREMKNGVLLSEIAPKNNILALVAPHFEDRLGCEDWMIYDRTRGIFAVHRRHRGWVLVEGERLADEEALELSEKETGFQNLWRTFCHSVSIRERENPALQQQNMPLRFRSNMTEFEK